MIKIYFTQQFEAENGEVETLHVGRWDVVEYKFRVHFRRPDGYQGHYGFDWLQDEFKTCPTLKELKKEYNPCEILNQEYLVPWMSLKNGYEHEINLAVETFEGIPSEKEVIRLKPQNGIVFEPAEIKITYIINNEIKHFPTGSDKGTAIKVKCTNAIGNNTEIKAEDKDGNVVGKLMFLKNDIEYHMPVRIVLLVRKRFEDADEQTISDHLRLNVNSDFKGAADLQECMKKLENEMIYNSFNQALINFKLDEKIYKVAIDEYDWKQKGYINRDGKIVARDDLNTDLLNLYKNQVERGSSGTGFFKGVVVMISYFDAVGMDGKANLHIIDDRNCTLFRITDNPNYKGGCIKIDDYIHEIGHVLSLTHTFQEFDKKK